MGQLALYGRVQIWQNQAQGLGLRVIPTLVVTAYIDSIYTVGKVISSSKKGSPELFIFQKYVEHFLGKCEKNTKLQNFKKIFAYLIQSISMHINGI